MIQILDRILGLNGIIPPEWKQRVDGLLLSLIAIIEMLGFDVPDEYESPAFIAKVVLVLHLIASFALKKLRD